MNGIYWKEGEAFSNSMSLIVSLMVRHPEIATLSLDPVGKSLHFTFLVGRALSRDEFEAFREKYLLCLDVMTEIHQKEYREAIIHLQSLDNFSFIEVTRDISSLTQEEIAMLVSLIRDIFDGELFSDQEDGLGEEEQVFQEELIDHMLEDLKDSRQEKRLIGIREEGRVMVFNRAEPR